MRTGRSGSKTSRMLSSANDKGYRHNTQARPGLLDGGGDALPPGAFVRRPVGGRDPIAGGDTHNAADAGPSDLGGGWAAGMVPTAEGLDAFPGLRGFREIGPDEAETFNQAQRAAADTLGQISAALGGF